MKFCTFYTEPLDRNAKWQWGGGGGGGRGGGVGQRRTGTEFSIYSRFIMATSHYHHAVIFIVF